MLIRKKGQSRFKVKASRLACSNRSLFHSVDYEFLWNKKKDGILLPAHNFSRIFTAVLSCQPVKKTITN